MRRRLTVSGRDGIAANGPVISTVSTTGAERWSSPWATCGRSNGSRCCSTSLAPLSAKATPSRRRPALTATRTLTSRRPLVSSAADAYGAAAAASPPARRLPGGAGGSRRAVCTSSPSRVTTRSCGSERPAGPVANNCRKSRPRVMSMSYSPLEGNAKGTRTPPRVPNGSPETCLLCVKSDGTTTVRDIGLAGAATASRLTFLAASRKSSSRPGSSPPRLALSNPSARIVRGQQLGNVDIEREQVANRVPILGAAQAAQAVDAARMRIAERGPVELRLQPGHQAVPRRRLRPRPTGGRHHAGAQLAEDLLPELGIGAHSGEIGPVEREAGGPEPVVVAAHAVALDQRGAARASVRAGGLLRRRRRRSGRAGGSRRAPSGSCGSSGTSGSVAL